MPFPFSNPQVTILNGQSLSASFYVGPGDIQQIVVPAGFTGTSLTFQGSYDNVTFAELLDGAGNALTETVAAGKACVPTNLPSLPYMKIRSGTVGSPSTQGADKILGVTVRKRWAF